MAILVTGDFREKLAEFADQINTDVAAVGAQAMAEQVYVQAKLTVPVSGIPTHYFYGTTAKAAPKGQKKQHAYAFHSQDLAKSLYQVFSKDRSTLGKMVYHVSWNHKKAPYGFMVEFGTRRAPAHPFLGPAYVQVAPRLLTTACNAMREKLQTP